MFKIFALSKLKIIVEKVLIKIYIAVSNIKRELFFFYTLLCYVSFNKKEGSK